MPSVRIATTLYVLLALPALVFGFLLEVAPLGFPCEDPLGVWSGPDTWRAPTSGEPCRSVDPATFYWLVPAIVLAIVGIGIAAARHEPRAPRHG